jgi:hypothetical protein
MREWRVSNPERDVAAKEKWRKANLPQSNKANRAWRYGMSRAELEVFISSKPVCEICGSPPETIDHDHATGRVRGHLCGHCNKGLGLFRDSQETLIKAAAYLERTSIVKT